MPHRYPSDVSDDEWAFVAPYLALVAETAPQRKHGLRRAFDALRYVIRSGCPWRYLPGDFPPWAAVYQQAQRWIKAGAHRPRPPGAAARRRRSAGAPVGGHLR